MKHPRKDNPEFIIKTYKLYNKINHCDEESAVTIKIKISISITVQRAEGDYKIGLFKIT